MNRLFLVIAALVAAIAYGVAQTVTMPPPAGTTAILCAYNSSPATITSANVGFVNCDVNGNLKAVLSGTPTSTEDVNLKQVAGATVQQGHGVAASAIRVELPTDGTGVVGLNAGSAVIGKVGVDQTTPGTTDLVTARYSRPFIVTKSFTQAAAYAVGNSIGPTGVGNAKMTLDISTAAGINMAGQSIKLRSIRWSVAAATAPATAAVAALLFSTAPAGTFTDAASTTWTAADIALLATGIEQTLGTPNIGTIMVGGGYVTDQIGAQDRAIVVDGSGNLTLILQSFGTFTYTVPAGYNFGFEFVR